MNTKEQLLEILKSNCDEYTSGEYLSKALSVSRSAVWKAIENLRHDGYPIDGISNLGYRLSDEYDILCADEVRRLLSPECKEYFNINYTTSTVSTNADVRAAAISGVPEGYVVIAEEQSGGRGRLGRTFHSPRGSGIYISILLRPSDISADRAVFITTSAAIAVCEAIEKVTGESASIKWVNDIFARGSKVCGILTEAAFDAEYGSVEYAVLGIGINVYTPDGGFSSELNGIAGSLLSRKSANTRARLCAEILHRVALWREGISSFADEYRRRCFVTGKNVTVIRGGTSREATALDTDDKCRLIVKYDDGECEALSSGEISIRL